jgi:hypothetical protein
LFWRIHPESDEKKISDKLPRGKPLGIKISVLSFLSQQAAGNLTLQISHRPSSD